MRLRWWVLPLVVASFLVASYGLAKTVRLATQTVEVAGREPHPGTETATVEFTVEGLKCWTMSGVFTEMLSREAGVIEIRTYVRTNTAVVTFDPSQTSPEKLAERINRPLRNPETGRTMSVFRVLETNLSP